METSPHNKNKTKKKAEKMKQKNRLTTEVTYWRGEGSQAQRVSARFEGHLSESEIERKMLFERQTPKRRIEGWQHQTN